MNILVIKQSSLGDVLHSTGPLRSIRLAFPEAHITLMTSSQCEAIYQHNPDVNTIITLDRDLTKQRWHKQPLRVWQHIQSRLQLIRQRDYDLAFDLQGLSKSVLFLYAAKADQKYVKGNWPNLDGYRNKSLHAITEMNRVLASAGIIAAPPQMLFYASDADRQLATDFIEQHNPDQRPVVIISPFTRWPSKTWSLDNCIKAGIGLSERACVLLSGAPADRNVISQSLESYPKHGLINAAGELGIAAFAELLRHANLLISGDSFPMHLAGAVNTPVLALFGPTDERKTGPIGKQARIIRAPGCSRCDKRSCAQTCIDKISVNQVTDAALEMLNLKMLNKIP